MLLRKNSIKSTVQRKVSNTAVKGILKDKNDMDSNIIRHQWFDLMVRVALKLFRVPNPEKKQGKTMAPADCFRKLMQNYLTPFYNRLGKVHDRPRDFISRDLLKSKPVQKYLFLNQFELHTIFEKFLAQPYTVVYGGEMEASKLGKLKKKLSVGPAGGMVRMLSK